MRLSLTSTPLSNPDIRDAAFVPCFSRVKRIIGSAHQAQQAEHGQTVRLMCFWSRDQAGGWPRRPYKELRRTSVVDGYRRLVSFLVVHTFPRATRRFHLQPHSMRLLDQMKVQY